MDIQFIQQLESILEKPLPGTSAQMKMASFSSSPNFYEVPEDHKVACVMLVLFPKQNEWNFVLIERNGDDLRDKHAGQLSLPGGKVDDNDKTLEDCALRETYEEIGINPSLIGILGSLTPLYVKVSNFLVHPFIGFTTEYPKFIAQTSEVSRIFETPLSLLTDQSFKKTTNIEVRNMVIHNVPTYNIQGKALWGATAMILSEFEEIMNSLEF
ncbi:MAG: CoA pyrophosphatase [Saprospiraceae bacterium]